MPQVLAGHGGHAVSANKRKGDARFWARVLPTPSGCWEWQGALNNRGYGQLGRGGVHHLAHRYAWVLVFGDIAPGLVVCHACDNRRCVRPSHLFLGTHLDNNRDMTRKGRARHPSVPRKLTDDDVRTIRTLHLAGVHPARGTGQSTTELARRFGVTRQYITQVVAGRWRA